MFSRAIESWRSEVQETMTRLSIELSDDLTMRAQARAAEAGYASVEAYLENLLRDDIATASLGAPDGRRVHDLPELQRMIRAGLDSGPAREISDVEWEQKRQDLIGRQPRV